MGNHQASAYVGVKDTRATCSVTQTSPSCVTGLTLSLYNIPGNKKNGGTEVYPPAPSLVFSFKKNGHILIFQYEK